MTQTIYKNILCCVPKFPSSFFVYCIILQRVTTAKGSILFIRMVIKRTFQNHNYLIFNDLRAFIGGGGGKNGQSIMWCKRPFSEKKEKNFPKEKKEKRKKRILSVSNALFLCWWVISPLSV